MNAKNILWINAYKNIITPENRKAICSALRSNTTLKGICYGNIGDDLIGELAEVLKVNKTIEKLTFLDHCMGTKGMIALSEVLIVNKHLRELECSGHRPSYSEQFIAALKINKSLTTICNY